MAEEYIDKVVTVGTEVVRAMAMGLGVDEKIFTSRIDRTFWNLRLLAYEGKEPNSDKEKIAGIGEHTGTITPPSSLLNLLGLIIEPRFRHLDHLVDRSAERFAASTIEGG